MKRMATNSGRGFTLVEMLIALTLGLVVVGAAVQLFSRSVSATWLISQRAELQQNARASSNLLTKDISLAGAGLPTGGVALASGTGIQTASMDATTPASAIWVRPTRLRSPIPTRPSGQPARHQLHVWRDSGMETGSHGERRRRTDGRDHDGLCRHHVSCSPTTP